MIVEQNVKQVLKVVDRAYIIEAGSLKMEGTSAELLNSKEVQKAYLGMWGNKMAEFTESLFSIFFIETLMNGLLLGGILALLSIGLNLIFGVIDNINVGFSFLQILNILKKIFKSFKIDILRLKFKFMYGTFLYFFGFTLFLLIM